MAGWADIALGIAVVVSLILIVRLYFMVHDIAGSFPKLGHVIREDAKKYFDDAAGKIIGTNEQFQSSYTKIVHDGTLSALTNAETVLNDTLSAAQREAGEIILKAREDAQNIISAAKTDATKQSDEAIGHSAETIRWVMEQYVGREFSTEQHEQIISRLLEEYTHEQRT